MAVVQELAGQGLLVFVVAVQGLVEFVSVALELLAQGELVVAAAPGALEAVVLELAELALAGQELAVQGPVAPEPVELLEEPAGPELVAQGVLASVRGVLVPAGLAAAAPGAPEVLVALEVVAPEPVVVVWQP